MQWECFVSKIAINPWVVFLSLQRRCTKQLLVFIRVHKSLANGIWWVWVILVIVFQILVFTDCTANISVVCSLLIFTINCDTYCKVASTNKSHIEPHSDIYRLEAYVEWTFGEKFNSLFVTRINTCSFTVCM